ncbi:hypothetical protein FVR03_00175 [Pontibacter qinzhouensis]|uniref:STAS/SEC14 domain-containing protein n=1 Tax=Pontibacter qinzhouensis TaxID=2603253 RepID=A0A5C8KBQ3_9BACT|nr:hypothetical protein [Pontibacter qinzhouensis]TXK52826.1 hypothetical protein FVR03_00175 [Pontibacter qinzhouensis]
MPFTTFYESDFYKIEVDTARNLLQAMWLRPVTGTELQEGGVKLYEVLRDTGVELAVANAKVLTSLSAETKAWMSSTFYELLSQTQLKRLARVLPDNMFHMIALESVVTRAEALGVTKFEVKNFSDPVAAFKWATTSLTP